MTTTANPVRRAGILREMGLGPLWRLRAPAVQAGVEVSEVQATAALVAPATPQPSTPPPAQPHTQPRPQPAAEALSPAMPATPTALASAPSEMEPAAHDYYQDLLTRTHDEDDDHTPAGFDEDTGEDPRARAIAAMNWDELRASVAACRACALCQERKQAVLGVGDVTADWLLVGEGPGAEEDERGEPFVGQAGKLLDAMLAAIDLRRGQDVYIANAVKCRPPNNRQPQAEEIAACRPYLERQIALIQPRLMLALGRPAAQSLLQSEVKIAAVRGKLLEYRPAAATAAPVPVIVTYHPAYLLRTLTDKAKAWEDLCFARRTMRARKTTT